MFSELQPLAPNSAAAQNPAPAAQSRPSRWRVLIGTGLKYLPDAVGSGFGGAMFGIQGTLRGNTAQLSAKLAGVGGIAVGFLMGVGMDLQGQWDRLSPDASRNQKIYIIARTVAKHVLVSSIFAATLGLSVYSGG